ncbi:hypothetical protein DPEC_G00072260 [Dallia pectoralis]|uniref:Uncharacterized protein n=1 Tax=Dallia pectoralis TaxID=75939 RepID=A0ACC2H3C9_DALPE|nr:hypothetical protein DPEC_G00072260 [Dallia pectoralis]
MEMTHLIRRFWMTTISLHNMFSSAGFLDSGYFWFQRKGHCLVSEYMNKIICNTGLQCASYFLSSAPLLTISQMALV